MPSELEQQADQHAMRRDFASARVLLERVTTAEPANFIAWMKLAALANAMGDAAASLRAVEGALKERPLDFTALLMRAKQLDALGNREEAGLVYGRALAQVPDEVPPQIEPALDDARKRYADWQQQQYRKLRDLVEAVTPVTEKLDRFITSTLRIEPFERDGPTHYCYPGLDERGFHDTADFSWVPTLEAATDAIEREFQIVVHAEAAQLVPYLNYPHGTPLEQWAELNNNRDWTAIHLIQNGNVIEPNARHCPELMAILAQLPQPDIAGAGPNAMFSLLAPGAHIPPHTGISNSRLVCHLPLIVPEGCWFRVGDETREWQRGDALIFDDTVEHEAKNPSSELRVVMICDCWHPALDEAERAGIKAVVEAGGLIHGL